YNKQTKLNFKNIIVLSIIGFLSIYLVYFLRTVRFQGGLDSLFDGTTFWDLNKQTFEMLLMGDGELSLRNAFYHFVYYDNNFPNFNEGHTYLRLLLLLIPTSLVPHIKPPDFGITMGQAWSGDFQNMGYSMHPTFFGNVFANSYWYGILFALIWVVFSLLIDKVVNRDDKILKQILMITFANMYIMVGRGAIYNA